VVKDKSFEKILLSESVSEVESILDEQYHALHLTQKVTERSVKKSNYGIFKFLTIVLVFLTVGMGIWLGLLLENTVPRQTRIIDAQAAYMMSNFNEATRILSEDNPRTLPSAVQYMLAVSYVELESLTMGQRQAIINNLSPSTSENELRYWIYIGRGNLVGALDIAYSIGSLPLQIHTYAHLYDYVYADMEMEGTVKQERLTRYRGNIERLRGALEGTPLEEVDEEGSDGGVENGN
jgi:type VII secretion protein EssB